MQRRGIAHAGSLVAVLFLAAALLLAGCANQSGQQVRQEIIEAERLGLLLFNAYSAKPQLALRSPREQDLLAMSERLRCEGTYSSVSFFDSAKKTDNTYFLLLTNKTNTVQFGRHLRFRFEPNTNDLIDVNPSSKACLSVSFSEGGSPWATLNVNPYPTEVHAFLSLYYQVPIFVSTPKGVWKISEGKFFEVER